MAITDSQEPSSPGKGSLAVLFLTVFIDLLGFAMVLPLLPLYAAQFSLDGRGWVLGALMASFSLMQFLFAPMWGALSDRIGRRPVIMIGLAGSVLFYALFGVATLWKSLGLLFATRIGAGIAGATIPIAQAYIADTTTPEKRSKGMALIGMAFGLGFTFGPLLGLLAVPTGSGEPGPWPGYVAAGLSAIAFTLAWFKLPESLRNNEESQRGTESKLAAWREVIQSPVIGVLLLSIFLCVFSFATFETTVGLLIKGGKGRIESPYQFDWGQICLTYAFIGFVLALVQGGLVRRMAGKVSDRLLAACGALLEMLGFGLLVMASSSDKPWLLMTALATIVSGFGFLQPSLNALLSRRTNPHTQGGILGLGQSASSLARIAGGGLGIPMLIYQLSLPSLVSAGLMLLALFLVGAIAKGGLDYPSPPESKREQG